MDAAPVPNSYMSISRALPETIDTPPEHALLDNGASLESDAYCQQEHWTEWDDQNHGHNQKENSLTVLSSAHAMLSAAVASRDKAELHRALQKCEGIGLSSSDMAAALQQAIQECKLIGLDIHDLGAPILYQQQSGHDNLCKVEVIDVEFEARASAHATLAVAIDARDKDTLPEALREFAQLDIPVQNIEEVQQLLRQFEEEEERQVVDEVQARKTAATEALLLLVQSHNCDILILQRAIGEAQTAHVDKVEILRAQVTLRSLEARASAQLALSEAVDAQNKFSLHRAIRRCERWGLEANELEHAQQLLQHIQEEEDRQIFEATEARKILHTRVASAGLPSVLDCSTEHLIEQPSPHSASDDCRNGSPPQELRSPLKRDSSLSRHLPESKFGRKPTERCYYAGSVDSTCCLEAKQCRVKMMCPGADPRFRSVCESCHSWLIAEGLALRVF